MSSDEETTQASDSEALGKDDDLVRKLADRVYQLLKQEARIESERDRMVKYHRRFGQGGR
jgi:hypothetical protein